MNVWNAAMNGQNFNKKNNTRISGPEELDKILKRTNPLVWVVLGAHIVLLLFFFVLAFIVTIEQKVEMTAVVSGDSIAIYADQENSADFAAGQKVYIGDETGSIVSVEDDGTVLISEMDLDDGAYKCNIVTREIKPIEFLWNK